MTSDDFQLMVVLFPGGQFAMSRDMVVPTWRGGGGGHWGVDGKDSVTHPTLHRIASHDKEFSH